MSAIDRTILHICRERAGLSLKHVDFDIAKHLACIVREDPTVQVRKKGESVALCAALVECADGGWDDSESVVVRVWGLDTREKRVAFLEEYTDLLFRCFLPPLVVHGFCFDAHGQNTRECSNFEFAEAFPFTMGLTRQFFITKLRLMWESSSFKWSGNP